MLKEKIILTGDRPTGKMHLGHYTGSIKSRVNLQNEFKTYIIIADLHMLTTKHSKQEILDSKQNIYDMVIDQLSCGIDPNIATFYLQSYIPELYEIYTLIQNLTTIQRLNRIPTIKDMQANANLEELPLSLLCYPVLQTADILSVKANLVPVGKDNYAHLELTRELAQRFNHIYGEVFPMPDTLKSENEALVGLDGFQKMSKSLNNAIFLQDSEEDVKKKVRKIYTDPNRISASTPGQVAGNPVFIYHDIFNPDIDEVNDLKERYKLGRVGDIEVKDKLAIAINNFLEPIRERRLVIAQDTSYIKDIIVEGSKKVRLVVAETLSEMKEKMQIGQL